MALSGKRKLWKKRRRPPPSFIGKNVRFLGHSPYEECLRGGPRRPDTASYMYHYYIRNNVIRRKAERSLLRSHPKTVIAFHSALDILKLPSHFPCYPFLLLSRYHFPISHLVSSNGNKRLILFSCLGRTGKNAQVEDDSFRRIIAYSSNIYRWAQ